MPAETKDTSPRAFGWRTDCRKPFRTTIHNMGDIRQGLYIIHHCWFLVETMRGRERRFNSRFAPLAFQRFKQRGFLPTNIRSGSGMNININGHPTPMNIRTQMPGLLGLFDGAF